ncbi:hypothetical protein PF005_g7601 [Phytophthora fragariae]|nr:hypothetical protein PF005_g7601 [Phytophthora fragariae]
MQTQQSEHEQYPPDERNRREGYPSMQAQQKSPSQYPPVPKRAAKDTPEFLHRALTQALSILRQRLLL